MPINMVIFSGSIVGDVRYFQGKTVCAIVNVEQAEQGTKRDGTPYVIRNRQGAKFFGQLADRAQAELRAGMQVVIQGRLSNTAKKQEDGTYVHDKFIAGDRWEVVGSHMQPQAQQMTFGYAQPTQGMAYAQPAGYAQQPPMPMSYAPPPPAPVQNIKPLQAPPPAPPAAAPEQKPNDDVPF